jgi:DNA-damage-inducible protein D
MEGYRLAPIYDTIGQRSRLFERSMERSLEDGKNDVQLTLEEKHSAMTEESYPISPFEAIRHEKEPLGDYWSARELARLLGYTEFGKFKKALERAEKACEQSGQAITDHFAHVSEMVSIGSGAKRRIEDVYLTRYAAYLTVQNADPSKPIVALGQQYFAIQTRKQELAAEALQIELTEPQLRLLRRAQMSLYNSQLAGAAYQAGVVTSRDFSIFQDHGYIGLYKERASEIRRRKHLSKKQEILDFMNSDELATNIFRASQTKQNSNVTRSARSTLPMPPTSRSGVLFAIPLKNWGASYRKPLLLPRRVSNKSNGRNNSANSVPSNLRSSSCSPMMRPDPLF